MFRTESFLVSDQESLSYKRKFIILNSETLRSKLPTSGKFEFRFEAVDAQSGAVLTTADVQEVTRNNLANAIDIKNIVFNLTGTKEIYLRVGLTLPQNLNLEQSMVEAYYIDDEQQESKKFGANAIQSAAYTN